MTAGEELSVRAAAAVYIADSHFNDDVEIRFGAADDELTVEGSSFQELKADGGLGENTFDDRGDNAILELELTRFDLAEG